LPKKYLLGFIMNKYCVVFLCLFASYNVLCREVTSLEKGAVGTVAGIAEVMGTGAALRNVMVELQRQEKGSNKGLLKVLRDVVKNPWSGAKPQVMSIGPTTAVQMGLKRALSKYSDNDLLTSALPGAASAVLCTPAETIATRQWVTKKGFMQATWELAQRGKLYAGVHPTAWRELFWSIGLQSWYKDLAKVVKEKTDLDSKMALTVLAGAPAGVAAALVSHPFATVGTVMQNNIDRSESMLVVAKKLIKHEGVKSLFKGAGPRALRAAIGLPVIVGASEYLENYLKNRVN
jgi:hypothetical protein